MGRRARFYPRFASRGAKVHATVWVRSPISSANQVGTGYPMSQDGHPWCSAVGALLLCAGLLVPAGCSSTQAAQQGTGGSGFADTSAQHGNAIAQAGPVECGPTDSTVSCCLKQHPGEYERCGAIPPKQAPTRAPKQTPKQAPQGEPEPRPPLTDLSPEDSRKREEKCREYWERCIARGGEYEKRGQYGQTICRACWQRCRATGSWPDKVNDFECLGGD